MAVATVAACEPAVKAPPVDDHVVVSGDSITFQSLYYGSSPVDDAWDTAGDTVIIGGEAEDVHPGVAAAVADPARSPDTLVVALGHNDVAADYGRDGFTDTDRNQLFALFYAASDEACTVLVLPHYGGTDPARIWNLEVYRNWVRDTIVAGAPDRFRLVDWRPVAQAHPEYLDVDGIHLNVSDPTAANAFVAMVQTGIDQCDV